MKVSQKQVRKWDLLEKKLPIISLSNQAKANSTLWFILALFGN